MRIDPATLLTQRDLAAAHRLNRVLAWLPRFHTDRRWNAGVVNAALSVTKVLPSWVQLHRDVMIKDIVAESHGRKVGVRLSIPEKAIRGIYLYFHGGAWVLGNARMDDGVNAELARACGMVVAAVDFHRAADDDLNHTVGDAIAATEWIFDHCRELGSDRIIIAGESSGAHLAACAFLELGRRRRLDGFAGFLSLCGAFDTSGSPSLRRQDDKTLVISAPSALRNLHRLMRSLTEKERRSPRFAPLVGEHHGLPPALFVAGQLDPICEDSVEMYGHWQEDNGNAQLLIVPEAPHGFNRLPTRLAAKTRAFFHGWLRQRLADAAGSSNFEAV